MGVVALNAVASDAVAVDSIAVGAASACVLVVSAVASGNIVAMLFLLTLFFAKKQQPEKVASVTEVLKILKIS